MADNKSIVQRHNNMAAIRGKDTKPEIVVRRYLWSHGFRYRLNHPRLPGRPDIVLRKYRTCIFVNGCFWHGHNLASLEVNSEMLKAQSADYAMLTNSECCKIPKTNREFWVKKIVRNRERDIEVKNKLASMGWHSITIWECDLKPDKRAATLQSLVYTLSKILLHDHKARRYDLADAETTRMVADDEEVRF